MSVEQRNWLSKVCNQPFLSGICRNQFRHHSSWIKKSSFSKAFLISNPEIISQKLSYQRVNRLWRLTANIHNSFSTTLDPFSGPLIIVLMLPSNWWAISFWEIFTCFSLLSHLLSPTSQQSRRPEFQPPPSWPLSLRCISILPIFKFRIRQEIPDMLPFQIRRAWRVVWWVKIAIWWPWEIFSHCFRNYDFIFR